MGQRPLTDDESAELGCLNSAIQKAIDIRTEWLDKKMVECSDLQVGDDIYDINTGNKLGTVCRLYRYFKTQNIIYDNSPHCDYEYKTNSGYIDNTSRQLSIAFGTGDQASRHFFAVQASKIKLK